MRSKIIPVLLSLFILAFFLPVPALAAGEGIFVGDSVPAGTTLDNDVVLFGQEVVIDGTVNGNVFVLGNQVRVNGKVDGSLILIAQNASVGGDVSGAVYALALTLDLPTASLLERDLYAAAVSLTSAKDSLISRHLYALGLDAGLNGQIGGDLHTVIGPIQLYNGLMRLLGFEELTLELHFEVPAGTPAPQGGLPSRHMRLKLLEPLPAFDWGEWGLKLLKSWGVLFIFSLLAYWLGRKPLKCTGEALAARPWRTLAIGVLVLVVAFNLFIVALLIAAIIFGLGLGLNFLGLWPVAVAFWVVAFAVLGVATTGLIYFIAYGAKIIVIHLVATWLLAKITPRRAAWLDLLALLAGTILYALLRSIPYAGWIIDLLVTSAGMGAAWLALQRTRQVAVPADPDPLPEPPKTSRSGKTKK